MKRILGLKASRICEIYRMGLPIPPGLVVSTEACEKYYEGNRTFPQGLEQEIYDNLKVLERGVGKKLGNEKDPLLISLRAGAERQMPGLMESCCNVGLNDNSVIGLARRSGNERFAWDTYRQFVEDFGSVNMGINREFFDKVKQARMKEQNISTQMQMRVAELQNLISDYMALVVKKTGRKFPQNPEEQLWMTIEEIYKSWNYKHSIAYRRMNDLLWLRGTGVTIQTMVFGNFNNRSGAGRVFSRNPLTGEKELYGEYLMNVQGEDLNGGRAFAPHSIERMKTEFPVIYKDLANYADTLECHFKDMQDFQFTIQDGKLYLLYSKDAKRTATAALKVAADIVHEGKSRECEAIRQIQPSTFKFLRSEQVIPPVSHKLLGKGIPGSISAVTGEVLFNKDKVVEWAKKGKT